MYVEAYELLRGFLEDEELNAYFREKTGKVLALIDAGPVVDSPSARIEFGSSTVGAVRDRNTGRDVNYRITFEFPLWSQDSMYIAHEILDKLMEFIGYKSDNGEAMIKTISPAMMEPDPERKLWTLTIDVTILIFV